MFSAPAISETTGLAPPTRFTLTAADSSPYSVTITAVTNGGSYYFLVSASNIAGRAASRLPHSAAGRTAQRAHRAVGDAVPGVVHHAYLAVPASNGGAPITSYVVTSPSAGMTSYAVNVPVSSACSASSSCSSVLTGLTDGQSYTFQVAAVNGAGTGLKSGVSGVAHPAGQPTAPQYVSATAYHSQSFNNVSFFPPAWQVGMPLASYVVSCVVAGATSTPRARNILAATVASYTSATGQLMVA